MVGATIIASSYNPSVSFNTNPETAEVKGVSTDSQTTQNLTQSDEMYYGDSQYHSRSEMIESSNIKIYPEDKVKFFPDPSMELGSKIYIFRANPITVIEGKRKTVYRTWKTNVEDFLVENQIELADKDQISVDLDSQLSKEQKITIIRVAETTITKNSDIEFETIDKNDDQLLRGKTRVGQEGKLGKREKKYLVRREDGIEVSRKLISDTVVEKPQTKIVYHGTKVVFIATGKASHVGSVYPAGKVAYRGLRGKKILVRNFANGKEVEVIVGDYGPDPAIHPDRIVDLSGADFIKIAGGKSGVLDKVGVAVIE